MRIIAAILGILLALTNAASAQQTDVPGTLAQYPFTFTGPTNFASTVAVGGNLMTFPSGAATLVGSGIHNTLGTGASSDTVLISTNTGFSNIFEVTNSGTASTLGTIAQFGLNLPCASCSLTLAAQGGATPSTRLNSGSGFSGGMTISTSAGNLTLSASPGSVIISPGLALTNLATQITNTILGNATASTAVPTALAIPSCSTTNKALTWTTSAGFGCNTISAGGTNWFNVNDYASLSAALTAATGAGCVYIPGGTTVSISSAVTPPANACIVGDGPSSVISVTSAAATGIIISNSGVILSNFDINYSTAGTTGGSCGGDASNGAAICVTVTPGGNTDAPQIHAVNIYQPWIGLYFNSNNFAYATNLSIKNATYIGADLASAANVMLTNVSANNTAVNTYTSQASLYIFGNTTGASIIGGEWYGASGYALFYSASGVGNLIKNAYFDSGSLGSVVTASELSLVGNWFSNGRVAPYYNGLHVTGSNNVTIQGNIFANSGLDGLLIESSSLITVSGNIAKGNGIGNGAGNTTKNGIEVNTGSSEISVTNNVATGNTNYGLLFDGAASAYIITGNVTSGNTQVSGIAPPTSGTFYGPGLAGSGTSANF